MSKVSQISFIPRVIRYLTAGLILSAGVIFAFTATAAPPLVQSVDQSVVETYPFPKKSYCKPAVSANLNRLDIPGEMVKSISYAPILRARGSSRNRNFNDGGDVVVDAWETWVRLKDRDGALIIVVGETTCFTSQVYTRAGLTVSGVKAY